VDIVHYAFQQFLDFLIGAGITLFMLFIVALIVTAINNMGKPKTKHLTLTQIGAALRDLAEYGYVYVDNANAALDIVKASPVRAQIKRISEKQYRVEEVK